MGFTVGKPQSRAVEKVVKGKVEYVRVATETPITEPEEAVQEEEIGNVESAPAPIDIKKVPADNAQAMKQMRKKNGGKRYGKAKD